MSMSTENGTVPKQITLDENAGSLSLSYSEKENVNLHANF